MIRREFKEVTAREFSIDACGWNFTVIVGRHINGGFIAVPNWGISADISHILSEVTYNATQIFGALMNVMSNEAEAKDIAREIARCLCKIDEERT